MGKLGKIITLYSPKGGTGKTVLSLNLAGVSSKMGYKTLLLDLDVSNGCFSMLLNIDINKTLFHLTDDFNNNRFKDITDYIYNYKENIDVLPSPRDPRQGNKISSKYISLILERLSNIYDVIIVDTNSKMDDINIVAMDNTDINLFVVNNDLYTLKNTRNIITIFNDCKLDNYKVLLNKSIDYKNDYFSLNDMKKIINTNIDYMISKDSFIKDITSYLYNSKIPSLVSSYEKKCNKDYNVLKLIIEDLKKEEENEKN